MKTLRKNKVRVEKHIRLFALSILFLGQISTAYAMPDEMGMGMPMQNSGMADKPMNEELTELRAKVARLEAALEKNHQGDSQKSMQMGMAMGGMQKGMGMKGMGDMQMAGNSDQMNMGGGSGMMGMDMMKMMGMMHGKSGMMGGGMGMANMGAMPQSALPGFPGISHIYHIGATGFFLDHAEHLSLTSDQTKKLEEVKARSQKSQTEYQTKIEETEKAIWELTGSDQPKIEEITAKIKEVENVGAEKRIAFIKAVGEAASLLTEEQRLALVTAGDSSKDPHAGHVH